METVKSWGMTSEEREVMEVDKTLPSFGKATTQKSQKVTSHELSWYARLKSYSYCFERHALG